MKDPGEGREAWTVAWPAVGVALCFGSSVAVLTGDWATGSTVAAVIAAVVLVAARLAPTQFRRQPAWRYLLAGLGVLIFPLVLLKFGEHRTPWYDLQDGYRATRATTAGSTVVREVTFVVRLDPIRIQPYRFRRVASTLTAEGLHLAQPWPMRLVYDPLWFPIETFESCEEWRDKPWFTMLAVRGTDLQIGLLDEDYRVLGWCGEAGISGRRGG